jgi:hypothetical protein
MKPVGSDLDRFLAALGCDRGDREFLAALIVACVNALRPLTAEQYTLDRIVLLAVKIFLGGDFQIDDSVAQSKMLDATITREIKARADKLRQRGESSPVTKAYKEAAEQYGHASGDALNKHLRRRRNKHLRRNRSP